MYVGVRFVLCSGSVETRKKEKMVLFMLSYVVAHVHDVHVYSNVTPPSMVTFLIAEHCLDVKVFSRITFV